MVMSDEQGLFAFETFVLDEYTLYFHEKNYIPVQETKTTAALEKLTRKVAPSAASDEVTIKLKPVPSISGNVRMFRNNKPAEGVWNADVTAYYTQGKAFDIGNTQTDASGNFFINLPSNQRGQTKVMVRRARYVDVGTGSVPSRKPINLVLKPTAMRASLSLSDKSALSGVRVTSAYLFPDNTAPDRANLINGPETFVGNTGGFSLPLAEKQKVELIFFLPDGQVIPKIFSTDPLLQKRTTFVYDPIAQDILSDLNPPKPQKNPSPKPATPKPAASTPPAR